MKAALQEDILDFFKDLKKLKILDYLELFLSYSFKVLEWI